MIRSNSRISTTLAVAVVLVALAASLLTYGGWRWDRGTQRPARHAVDGWTWDGPMLQADGWGWD